MQYQHALSVFTWGLDNLVMEKPCDRMLVFGRIPLSIPQVETLIRMQITVTCSDFDAALLKIAGVTVIVPKFFSTGSSTCEPFGHALSSILRRQPTHKLRHHFKASYSGSCMG